MTGHKYSMMFTFSIMCHVGKLHRITNKNDKGSLQKLILSKWMCFPFCYRLGGVVLERPPRLREITGSTPRSGYIKDLQNGSYG